MWRIQSFVLSMHSLLCAVLSHCGEKPRDDVRADVAGICALSVLVLQTQLLGMNAEPAHKGKLQGIH